MRLVLVPQSTEDYELINYSDHGSVVDGVLYSCDFSDKQSEYPPSPSSSPSSAPLLTLDDITALGSGVRAERARKRMEAARKSLEDQERARKALEGALNLAAHFHTAEQAPGDDKAPTRTTFNSSSPLYTGIKRNLDVSSIVSIPLTKTKKGVAGSSGNSTPKSSSVSSSSAVTKTSLKDPSFQANLRKSIRLQSSTQVTTPLHSLDQASASSSSKRALLLCEEEEAPHTPCNCKRSASSLVGTSGRGWEGTATLYHGSRLRFGCVHFVLSISGRPGHLELLQSLEDLSADDDMDVT